jgi:hypothetical protein
MFTQRQSANVNMFSEHYPIVVNLLTHAFETLRNKQARSQCQRRPQKDERLHKPQQALAKARKEPAFLHGSVVPKLQTRAWSTFWCQSFGT